MRACLWYTLLLLVLSAGRSAAQNQKSSIELTGECQVAAQVLRTGEPAPRREWARAYMPSCGFAAWGEAAAAAVRRLRDSEDVSLLGVEWRRLSYLHDAQLFGAAVEIASDANASAPARVLALRYLLTLTDPAGEYGFGAMTEPGDAPGIAPVCTSGAAAGESPAFEGAPLPDDFPAQIRSLADTLLSDAAALPQMVRSAALCVRASPVRNKGRFPPS
jgi:hypothetical protein